MDRPDMIVSWLQNDYGALGRAAESVAHALVDEGLAGRVAYVEPPVPTGAPNLSCTLDRGLDVYSASGAGLPGPDVAAAVVANSQLRDPILLNFGVAEANWWFHHGFAPVCSRTVLVTHDLLHLWPGMDPGKSSLLARVRRLLVHGSDAVAGLSTGAIPDVQDAVYVGHGCDAIWTRPSVDAADEPADMAGIPHPRALYYGALSVRIEIEALAALADSGIDVVLVGFAPSPPLAALISAHPRIHWLGQKTPEESAAYLLHADVGIVPHTAEPFTMSMEPHKIYNYACAGLPTVALHCVCPPALEGVATMTDSPAGFVTAVHAASERGRLARSRVDEARAITWASVARRLLSVATGAPVGATNGALVGVSAR